MADANDNVPEDELDLAEELADLWDTPGDDAEEDSEFEDDLIDVFSTDLEPAELS
jgi:hypothetical protein